MKKLIGIAALAFAAASLGVAAPSARYENFGTLTNVPQVDAITFANYGIFSVAGALPYTTQNTLNFTNRGEMVGFPGFRLENVADSGLRRPAANFFNANGASLSGGVSQFFGGGFASAPAVVDVRATNILNRGNISVAPGGLIRLEGQTVDLQRSGLLISPITGSSESMTDTNFFPETGVFDLYWGIGAMPDPVNQNPVFTTDRLLSTVGKTLLVDSGSHSVTNATGRRRAARLQLTGPSSYVYTNAVGVGTFTITNTVAGTTNTTTTNLQIATNIVVQAIFVASRDTNLTTSVTLYGSTIPTNQFKTVVVQLASVETNVVSGKNDFTSIYLVDRLASETNYNTLTNLSTQITFMPANFEVARVDPVAFGIRPLPTAVTNRFLTKDLLYHKDFTNAVVTNTYSSYSFFFTNQLQSIPNVPNASITNLPGRVEIFADNLNLERTRIRGEGLVNINAKHLESTKLAAIDVQNVNYNLATTNGLLSVENLTKSELQRTAGTISAFSAIWTNQSGFALTNTLPDPNDTNGQKTVQEILTNTVDITFHVLLVDARTVFTRQPNYVANFEATGETVRIADTLRLSEGVKINAKNLILSGKMLFGGPLSDWADVLFPGLQSVTNSGVISVPGTGFFGADRSTGYNNFVNSGTNVAVGVRIKSSYFENTGTILAGTYIEQNNQAFLSREAGSVSVEADITKLDGGRTIAGGDIQYVSRQLKMRNYTNDATQSISFNVSDDLSDSGASAPNLLKTTAGVHLDTKPLRGDLLGTKIQSTAARFASIAHTWSGSDLGPTKEGYFNNAAVGWFTIEGGLDSFQEFSGVGAKSALYVDYLEIGPTYLANLSDYVKVNPNLTIYFADSNMSASDLDGALGGRVRWVSEYAGSYSSVDVALPSGKSIRVNRQFIQSNKIDSDGDGIANGFDATPFGGVKIQSVSAKAGTGVRVSLTWDSAAGVSYTIEYTTNLMKPTWQVVTTYRNTGGSNAPATVDDVLPQGAPERYYRIRYNP